MKRKLSTVRWPLKPPLAGEVGILEDAGTRILDKMPRLNAKGTQCNSWAKLTVWLTETGGVVTYALCGVRQNELESMAGIFGLA